MLQNIKGSLVHHYKDLKMTINIQWHNPKFRKTAFKVLKVGNFIADIGYTTLTVINVSIFIFRKLHHIF